MDISFGRSVGASNQQTLRPCDKIDWTRLCHLRQWQLVARQIYQIEALLMRTGTLEGPAAGSEVMTGMNACDADGVVAVDLLSKGDCCDAALN